MRAIQGASFLCIVLFALWASPLASAQNPKPQHQCTGGFFIVRGTFVICIEYASGKYVQRIQGNTLMPIVKGTLVYSAVNPEKIPRQAEGTFYAKLKDGRYVSVMQMPSGDSVQYLYSEIALGMKPIENEALVYNFEGKQIYPPTRQ